MEIFTTLTEKIRTRILLDYEIAKAEFESNNQENLDDTDINEEYLCDIENFDLQEEDIMLDNCEAYETEVYGKILTNIKKSKYKNITYLIMTQDVWEYLKVKQISNIELLDYEEEILLFLEKNNIENIFRQIKYSNEFENDLITLFIEYHYTHEIENRIINRKIIELSNKENNYKKFKVKVLDDVLYQRKKTGK